MRTELKFFAICIALIITAADPSTAVAHSKENFDISVEFHKDGTYSFSFPHDFDVYLPTDRVNELKEEPGMLEHAAQKEFSTQAKGIVTVLKNSVHLYFDDMEAKDPLTLLPSTRADADSHDGPTEVVPGKMKLIVSKVVSQTGIIPKDAGTFSCYVETSGLPMIITIKDFKKTEPVIQNVEGGARSEPYILSEKKKSLGNIFAVAGLAAILGAGVAIMALRQRKRLSQTPIA